MTRREIRHTKVALAEGLIITALTLLIAISILAI